MTTAQRARKTLPDWAAAPETRSKLIDTSLFCPCLLVCLLTGCEILWRCNTRQTRRCSAPKRDPTPYPVPVLAYTPLKGMLAKLAKQQCFLLHSRKDLTVSKYPCLIPPLISAYLMLHDSKYVVRLGLSPQSTYPNDFLTGYSVSQTKTAKGAN